MSYSCVIVRHNLWDYFAGRLDSSATERIANHLEVCVPCQREARSAQNALAAVNLAHGSVGNAPTGWEAVRNRMAASVAVPQLKRDYTTWPAVAALASLALCVAIQSRRPAIAPVQSWQTALVSPLVAAAPTHVIGAHDRPRMQAPTRRAATVANTVRRYQEPAPVARRNTARGEAHKLQATSQAKSDGPSTATGAANTSSSNRPRGSASEQNDGGIADAGNWSTLYGADLQPIPMAQEKAPAAVVTAALERTDDPIW